MLSITFQNRVLTAQKVLIVDESHAILDQERINGGRGEERVTLHNLPRVLCIGLSDIHTALLSRCISVTQP